MTFVKVRVVSNRPGITPALTVGWFDLSGRLGVAARDIGVVEVREVTWSDGSLGCPQPGMSYTQSLVNGQLIVLALTDQRYEYHSGPNRAPFFCADPRPPIEMGVPSAGDG